MEKQYAVYAGVGLGIVMVWVDGVVNVYETGALNLLSTAMLNREELTGSKHVGTFVSTLSAFEARCVSEKMHALRAR